ncbi:hypothetical protein [Anaerosinus gibii]|uniref:Uncharacterized protein n=1 Tax=Selenobaculum gibii TaxID=3054208 RepID=A0A9Y2AGX3_9FIRM|nr:hypothetical protein [Selenobaculum gbiensis]WIW70599.1 hypothetical protein P3F81_12045 [Selenobaculum gbiensis]
MFYCERLSDGTIGRYTNNAKLAKKYEWTGQTKTEPIMYDGKLYLQSDYNALIQSAEYKAQQAEHQKQQQLAKLESDYQTAVAELQKSLNIAQLRNDIALIADIRNDFAELQASYQTEKEEIENVASTETV